MGNRALKKLLRHKDPYDASKTDQLFTDAIRDNARHHERHCEDYARILKSFSCDLNKIKTIDDIKDIPFFPTLYFKRHELYSLPYEKMAIKGTS